MAFLIAAYRHYLRYKVDDEGITYTIAEPWLTPADQQAIDSSDPSDFLSLSAFEGVSLRSEQAFTALYIPFTTRIHEEGVKSVLTSIVT